MRQHTKGIACMLFSAASFSLMNVCAHMAGDLPAMQKSFFRNLIALGVSLLLITIRKAPFRIPKGQFRHLFSRSFFGTIGVVCNYYAVDHMFLSDATMLNKMSPFFLCIVCSLAFKRNNHLGACIFPERCICWLCIHIETGGGRTAFARSRSCITWRIMCRNRIYRSEKAWNRRR